jgi:cystathionine beta-lyase
LAFDFDQSIDRTGTHSVKFDARASKFGDASVTPLWVADMDFAAPPCVIEAVTARAQHPIYGYTLVPETVYDAVIDWHAARYDWTIEREGIVLTPGTLPALSVAIAALTEPAAGVIIQPPVYGPFAAIIEGCGRRVVANPLIEKDGHYRIDHEHLERCAAEGARMLVLCNPHNPVGRVWDRGDLDAILALTRRYDLTVFSDDIHADVTYSDADFVPLGRLARASDRVITALSPSKTFNIQGLALTALIVPDRARREAINAAVTARHLENFNPFSLVAAAAAWGEGGAWRDALVAYLQATRDQLVDYVNRDLAPLRVRPPEASYLMWLDCRELGVDDAALEDFFIARCGLGLNAGTEFGIGGSGFMRLNIGAPRARIMDALQSIRRALKERTT